MNMQNFRIDLVTINCVFKYSTVHSEIHPFFNPTFLKILISYELKDWFLLSILENSIK